MKWETFQQLPDESKDQFFTTFMHMFSENDISLANRLLAHMCNCKHCMITIGECFADWMENCVSEPKTFRNSTKL